MGLYKNKKKASAANYTTLYSIHIHTYLFRTTKLDLVRNKQLPFRYNHSQARVHRTEQQLNGLHSIFVTYLSVHLPIIKPISVHRFKVQSGSNVFSGIISKCTLGQTFKSIYCGISTYCGLFPAQTL